MKMALLFLFSVQLLTLSSNITFPAVFAPVPTHLTEFETVNFVAQSLNLLGGEVETRLDVFRYLFETGLAYPVCVIQPGSLCFIPTVLVL